MEFVSIDLETANANLASICQIGVVSFCAGEIRERWCSLLDPEDFFDAINVSIHGIDEATVANAPKFPEVSPSLCERLRDQIVVSHTTFDRAAIAAVFSRFKIDPPEVTWLDTARVVRRAWPELSRRGYGLANVAEKLGISFEHHNAEDDARVAGEILVRVLDETNLSLSDWVMKAARPISTSGGSSSTITRDGDPEGALYGEVAVFTGALSMPRREAADLADASGCKVASSVTSSTTLLVVGDQDVRHLAGHEKSSKHRKAEKLISNGQAIRVLRETDFLALVNVK